MTDTQELVQWAAQLAIRLGKGKEKQIGTTGISWMTCCPAHDDENPSLNIRVDDQIRFRCMAGCEDAAIREAILALGYRSIPSIKRTSGKNPGTIINRIVHEDRPPDAWWMSTFQRIPGALYTYTNPKGETLFHVARFEADPPSKKIVRSIVSARIRETSEDYWLNTSYPTGKGYGRPLYNLLELLERRNDTVLVVEGEKTAEAAKELLPQYVVTTWSGGATAVKSTQFGPLAGRNVIIWPDNDKAGLAAMRDIASMLGKGGPTKEAASLRTVLQEVDTVFPPGFDLANEYLEDYLPIDEMLFRASEIDTSRLADTPLPADDEEVLIRLEQNLNRFAALHLGSDFLYVDLTAANPNDSGVFPYVICSQRKLLAMEVDCYLDLQPGKSPRRRPYIEDYLESNKKKWLLGAVYDPTTLDRLIPEPDGTQKLNLFCGFAYPPKQCDPKRYQCFIDHIYASCRTREEADYLLQWLAYPFQNTGKMVSTMVVLAGRQGCGKSLVARILLNILGTHNSVQVTQDGMNWDFNSQYANKLLINFEEYNPGQSKGWREYREKIKNLITANSILVNPKFIPAFEQPCCHSIIATTNVLTPEAISHDNRRMSFFNFDNPNLKVETRFIKDPEYFKPLEDLLEDPVGMCGLAYYLSTLKIDWSVITKPFDTPLTEEALSFIDNPVFDFLRTIAEMVNLPATELDMPDNSTRNPYPLGYWPERAAAMPRHTLVDLFVEFCARDRRQLMHPVAAGRALMKALMRPIDGKYQFPRGIPDTFNIDSPRTWSMLSSKGETKEFRDRAMLLPDIDELRAMVEKEAGTALEWSGLAAENDPGANVVVDFPSKKIPDDPDQF